jgi:serine phosphatase RsbU (regulator of sigma subunit)
LYHPPFSIDSVNAIFVYKLEGAGQPHGISEEIGF